MPALNYGYALQIRFKPSSSPGTRNGDYPFWSPESRYIGFFADGKLKKIAVTGARAQTLCDVPQAAAEPGIRTA